MKIFVLLALLIAALIRTRTRVLETAFGILIATAVAVCALSSLFGFSATSGLAGSILIALVLLSHVVRKHVRETHAPTDEGLFVAAFLGMYLVLYWFVLRWPDFISMGERLRDFAVLSAVIHSPAASVEPWLPSLSLNYYLIWYRVAAVIDLLTSAEVYEIYHSMVALVLSFYFTFILSIFRRDFKLSWSASVVIALAISFGSNFSGLHCVVTQAHWWGPSRVIAGAINEFPAWSFLLGDLHPHYMNMPFIPFALSLAFGFVPQIRSGWARLTLGAILGGALLVVCYGLNAWEVPIVGAVFGVFFLFSVLFSRFLPVGNVTLRWEWIAVAIVFVLAVIPNIRNIHSPPAKLSFVSDTIPRTTLREVFWHWGIPFGFLTLALCLRVRSSIARGLRIIAALVVLTLFQDALPFFLYVLVVLLWDGFLEWKKCQRSSENWNWTLLAEYTLLISALSLLILPEIIFLDDAYGGDSERMNTIFKIYTPAWFLLSAGSALAFIQWLHRFPELVRPRVSRLAGAAVLILTLPFFLDTASKYRALRVSRYITPRGEGLVAIDDKYRGARETILYAKSLPLSVILEGQGPAYSETTHVATLSTQYAYLGWLNHLNLLYPGTPEVGRREALVAEFYGLASCQRRREILLSEHIALAVVGPIELQTYPSLPGSDFSCLSMVFSNGGYRCYSASPSDMSSSPGSSTSPSSESPSAEPTRSSDPLSSDNV